MLLAGFEPEDESPIVFLRLRKAVAAKGLRVFSVAALASPGLVKLSGTLMTAVPGRRGRACSLPGGGGPVVRGGDARRAGRGDLGRRAARRGARRALRGGARGRLGARLAWVPAPRGRARGRRGRGAARAAAHRPPGTDRRRAPRWPGLGGSLPARPGRDTTAILAAAADGELGALVVPVSTRRTCPTRGPRWPRWRRRRSSSAWSCGQRGHRPRRRGVPGRRGGREGRHVRELGGARGLVQGRAAGPRGRTDLYVLGAIADRMDVHLGLPDAEAARAELGTLGTWRGAQDLRPSGGGRGAVRDRPAGEDVLSTWHQLLDAAACRTASRTWPARPARSWP